MSAVSTFLLWDRNKYFFEVVNILTKRSVLFQGGFDQVSRRIPGPSISRSAGNQNEMFIELGTTKRKISSFVGKLTALPYAIPSIHDKEG